MKLYLVAVITKPESELQAWAIMYEGESKSAIFSFKTKRNRRKFITQVKRRGAEYATSEMEV